MSRISAPRLAVTSLQAMAQSLDRWAFALTTQINNLAEERLVSHHAASAAAPTTGSYNVGDFRSNNVTVEAGAAGSKYVIIGWVCVTAGTPGTWKECRCLTGG